MTKTPTARATTRDVLPDAPDQDAEERRAKHGFPWCDTCQRPSVATEGIGLSHSTTEFPFGAHRGVDPFGDHEVTHRQWFATPSCVDDPFFRHRDDA